MTWWLWLIISVYGFGVILGWFLTVTMAIDEYWKFSQLALCLIWPFVLFHMVVFDGDIPGWFENHWG